MSKQEDHKKNIFRGLLQSLMEQWLAAKIHYIYIYTQLLRPPRMQHKVRFYAEVWVQFFFFFLRTR